MKNKLTIAQFNELSNISPIAGYEDKEDMKEIKFKLLDCVQEGLSDKWYNLKKNTQQALQYICMRSQEKGFFFCSPEHISKKFKVSITTVYSILKELIVAGTLYKVNRTAKTHNGKGNGVYMFTNHPNFPIICELLGLDWKADCNADCKAENDGIPCDSKDESDNSASTYLLPTTLLVPKDNVKHCNVTEDDNEIDSYANNDSLTILQKKIEEFKNQNFEEPTVTKWHKYVPKSINEQFNYFGSLLTDLWRKIKLAERKVKLELSNEDKMEVAESVLNNLKKHPKFKSMSSDEMCAYVYKGQLNGLFNLAGNQNLECMFINSDSNYYAYLDAYGNHIPTTSSDEINWINGNENKFVVDEFVFSYGESSSLENFPF